MKKFCHISSYHENFVPNVTAFFRRDANESVEAAVAKQLSNLYQHRDDINSNFDKSIDTIRRSPFVLITHINSEPISTPLERQKSGSLMISTSCSSGLRIIDSTMNSRLKIH